MIRNWSTDAAAKTRTVCGAVKLNVVYLMVLAARCLSPHDGCQMKCSVCIIK